MKHYKRLYRELSDSTKEQISKSTRGKAKSAEHKQHIATSMRRYWAGVPSKPQPITMADYLGAEETEED